MSAIVCAFLSCLPLGQAAPDDSNEEAKAALRSWIKRFEIFRPWLEPDVPEGSRHHRGPLTHVVSRLGGVQKAVLRQVYRDLGRLLALDASTEAGRAAILASRSEHAGAHGKIFNTDVHSLWKRLILPGESPEPPWGKSIKEWYYSRADGTAQRFDVRFPPKVEGRDRYPMMVVLKGGPRTGPSKEHPYIQVRPSGRGVWGPCSLSGWDALQVVDHMKRAYPVDPDRISVAGFSAGASAAMHLVSRHADEFSAVMPMVAFGTGVPLFNLKNLPVAAHHGSHDWTSAACNVRVQVKRLQELKYPIEYVEYDGVGHSVPGSHAALVTWMLEQKRDPCPKSIALQCETPDLGRSHWFQVLEFEDPHRIARVEASLPAKDGGIVKVSAENVRRFSLDLGRIRKERASPGFVEIGEQRLSLEGVGSIECELREERWSLVAGKPPGGPRPYRAGAAANLYQGKPLILVYGTQVAGRRDLLLQLARKLSRYGGPHHGVLRSRFLVLPDTVLTPEQEARCNLILVGTPEENRITGDILPELPISIREGTLEVKGRPALPLRDQVLSLLARHPKHPDRLVYLVAPFMDDAGLKRFEREAPQRSLIGSDGFDRISQADLVVQNLDGEIGRRMQFDREWAWIDLPGSDRPLPPRFRDRTETSLALLDLMRRGPEADVALWWGPADGGMWGYDFNTLKRYNPDFFTEADLRVRRAPLETMIGGATGRELKEIWERWGKNRELLFPPGVDVASLEDAKRYRVRIPMDLYIKLGQRKKTLDAPAFGPPITPEQFRKALFP